MSFSYSGNPDVSPQDAVRWELGDTTEKIHFVQDEEIQYALKREGTVLKAAARCAEAIAARMAREENVRTSTYASLRSMLQKHYEDLAKKLRVRGIRKGSFLCPSMTRTGKYWNKSDADLQLIETYKGIHHHAETSTSKTDP